MKNLKSWLTIGIVSGGILLRKSSPKRARGALGSFLQDSKAAYPLLRIMEQVMAKQLGLKRSCPAPMQRPTLKLHIGMPVRHRIAGFRLRPRRSQSGIRRPR